MSNDNINAIKARLDAASTGPWIHERGDYSGKNWLVGSVAIYTGQTDDNAAHWVSNITTDHVHGSELRGTAEGDAEFIAHARGDVEYLLRLVEQLAGVTQ